MTFIVDPLPVHVTPDTLTVAEADVYENPHGTDEGIVYYELSMTYLLIANIQNSRS